MREERTDLFEELLVLVGELVNPRRKRQHQAFQAVAVERIDPLGRHPELESDRSNALNASRASHTDAGGEQLPCGWIESSECAQPISWFSRPYRSAAV
jgi:hypothetical protein